MKKNIFISVLIFSILISFSIEIYENDEFKSKFLPKSNKQNIDNSLLGFVSNQMEEKYEFSETKNGTDEQKDQEERKDKTYVNIKCLFVSKFNVYSLQKLSKDKGYTKELDSGNKVKYNFCKDLEGFNSTMVYNQNDTNTNVLFAGSINGNENSKNEWLTIDDDSGEKGVKIRLAEGSKCGEDRNHLTIFKIYCDDKIADDQFESNLNFSEFNENGCTHYITGRSIYGCALNDWYLLRRLMKEYKYIFAPVLILIGLFLALFGERCETPTLILVTGALLCYLVTVIILNFIPSLIKTEKNLWILLSVTAAAGGIIGIFLKKKIIIFGVLVGAFGGYTSAEFVYQFVAGFVNNTSPSIVYYVVMGVCVLIGGFLGYWAVRWAIIICTSIIGGYCVMRGISLIGGNYVDFSEFYDLVKNGEFEQLKNIKNYWIYAYLGAWIVVALAGCYYQCYGYKKRNKNKKENIENDKDRKDYKKI